MGESCGGEAGGACGKIDGGAHHRTEVRDRRIGAAAGLDASRAAGAAAGNDVGLPAGTVSPRCTDGDFRVAVAVDIAQSGHLHFGVVALRSAGEGNVSGGRQIDGAGEIGCTI